MKEYIQQPHKNNMQESAPTNNRRQSLSIIDNSPIAIQQKRILGYMTTTKNVLQCQKEIEIDEWKLTIASDDFEEEAKKIFKYLRDGNLLERFIDKNIYIQKAPGTQDQVCHHWAFGGLTPGFDSGIEEIHKNLGLERKASEFGPEIPGELIWPSDSQKLVLNTEGAETQIRIYDTMAHSSRLMKDIWWHKFIGNEFIFGIEGGDENLIYKSYEDINIKAYPSKIAGASSHFTYKKK